MNSQNPKQGNSNSTNQDVSTFRQNTQGLSTHNLSNENNNYLQKIQSGEVSQRGNNNQTPSFNKNQKQDSQNSTSQKDNKPFYKEEAYPSTLGLIFSNLSRPFQIFSNPKDLFKVTLVNQSSQRIKVKSYDRDDYFNMYSHQNVYLDPKQKMEFYSAQNQTKLGINDSYYILNQGRVYQFNDENISEQ